jgi:hypothetical protein
MKIKIIFTYPTKWFRPFAWIIKLRLGTSYSHVAIVAEDPFTGIPEVHQSTTANVAPMELSFFRKKNKLIKEKELSLSEVEFRNMMTFIRKNQGKGYSEAAAIASTIPLLRSLMIGKDGDHEFICSEFVVRSLQATGGRLDFSHLRREIDYVDPLVFERILDTLCRESDDRCLLST